MSLIGSRHSELLGGQYVARLAADQILRKREMLLMQPRIRRGHPELLSREHVDRGPNLQPERRVRRRNTKLLGRQYIGRRCCLQADYWVGGRYTEHLSRQYLTRGLFDSLIAHLSIEF